MANIPSQKKRIKRSERERLENRFRISQVRTWFRRLEEAVTAGDSERAEQEYRTLLAKIDKAIKTGALHRNAGARRKSRAARLRARLGSS
ncbi:30S ribosomal protein S20 [Thermoleophilum album]|uniref:Small ribosomal subunit protein bS20 n=1 Tax=Thermoleophilum album TaxID=29539 RepID=A0A1H6FUY5_THEAL|nr:30S ribosomal protein S20 [Thermoleophilum album]SEH13968.1 small subunit ribosomal protein S20 [Thermoleophilum album]